MRKAQPIDVASEGFTYQPAGSAEVLHLHRRGTVARAWLWSDGSATHVGGDRSLFEDWLLGRTCEYPNADESTSWQCSTEDDGSLIVCDMGEPNELFAALYDLPELHD